MGLILLDFKIYHKAPRQCVRRKKRKRPRVHNNRVQKETHIYSQLTVNQCAKAISWGKDTLFNTKCRNN